MSDVMLPKFHQEFLESLKNGSRILKVGLLRHMPYVMPCWTGYPNETVVCKDAGLSVEITHELCRYLGITCHQIPVDHLMYGDKYLGEWRGMIRQVMDGEFDMSMPLFSPTAERSEVVDFSIPVYAKYPLLMTRFPTESTFAMWSIFGFSVRCWVLIVGTILLIGLLSTAFNWFQNDQSLHDHTRAAKRFKIKKQSVNAVRTTLDVASLFTNQGMADRNFSAALCVLFGIWSLCCVVLAGTYSSQILVSALATDHSLPFKDFLTLAQCIKRGKCILTATTMSTAFFERVRNAVSPPMQEMKLALEIRPVVLESEENFLSSTLGNLSTYHVRFTSGGYYAQLLQTSPPCTLDAVHDNVVDLACIPFKKGSPLKKIFEPAIIALQENGVIAKMLQKYVGQHIAAQELFCKNRQMASKPMAFTVFYGLFAVVGMGSAFGLLVLVIEKCYWQNIFA